MNTALTKFLISLGGRRFQIEVKSLDSGEDETPEDETPEDETPEDETPEAPVPEDGDSIDAQVIRNQEGSGQCLISGGFPLPPGLVNEQAIREGRVKVFVEGEEVAANVSALRGRHHDESLRSMLIQFSYSLAEGDVLPAQVIISDTARSYPDPGYQRPTFEIVTNNNVIIPTEPAYLITTNLHLKNMIPVEEEDDTKWGERDFYTNLAEDRFDHLTSVIHSGSNYEGVSAVTGLWLKTGKPKFHKQMIEEGTGSWLDYRTPVPDHLFPEGQWGGRCVINKYTNPDDRDPGHTHCAVGREQKHAHDFGFAIMYLLTGYRDYWGRVAYTAQFGQMANKSINSSEDAADELVDFFWDYPRTNYVQYKGLIPALMIDATAPVDYINWKGGELDWDNALKWTIDAFEHHAWDLKWVPFNNGGGTCSHVTTGHTLKQGNVTATIMGTYKQKYAPPADYDGTTRTPDMPESGYFQIKASSLEGGSFQAGELEFPDREGSDFDQWATATGPEESDYREGLISSTTSSLPREIEIPIFQLLFPAYFMIDHYLYIKNDDRIPGMVETILDAVLLNIEKIPEEDQVGNPNTWGHETHGNQYTLANPPRGGRGWTMPVYARICAFVLKTIGDKEVNGKKYSEWYKLFVYTGNVNPHYNLNWRAKHFGQFYWGQDAPWMMAQESLVGFGPEKMRQPTQYDKIPGDEPDIARESK